MVVAPKLEKQCFLAAKKVTHGLLVEYVFSQNSACAGAQALEAQRIYIAMKDGLCCPDALTLTSLATAYQRAGNWDRAEQVRAPHLAACVPALPALAQRASCLPCKGIIQALKAGDQVCIR